MFDFGSFGESSYGVCLNKESNVVCVISVLYRFMSLIELNKMNKINLNGPKKLV